MSAQLFLSQFSFFLCPLFFLSLPPPPSLSLFLCAPFPPYFFFLLSYLHWKQMQKGWTVTSFLKCTSPWTVTSFLKCTSPCTKYWSMLGYEWIKVYTVMLVNVCVHVRLCVCLWECCVYLHVGPSGTQVARVQSLTSHVQHIQCFSRATSSAFHVQHIQCFPRATHPVLFHVQHIQCFPHATHPVLSMCNTSCAFHMQHILCCSRATHPVLFTCNTSCAVHVQHIQCCSHATHPVLFTCNTSGAVHMQHIRCCSHATHPVLFTCNTSCAVHVRHIQCCSHATHPVLFTCNMMCVTWCEGTAQLLSLTEFELHFEGFEPKVCITTMIHSRGTPFCSETLNLF